MLINSNEQLQNAGYCSIGIDHFAGKDDELARAFNNKKLHRNFQGYCTLDTTGQVYGFGTSSISQMWGSYSQNHKDITKYINSIENTGYATERGYKLNGDEQIVRFAINSIMCNGILDFNETASKFRQTVKDIKNKLDFNPSKILEFQEDNLVSFKDDKINLNERGRMVARNIAMAFDPALKQGESIYSKTV